MGQPVARPVERGVSRSGEAQRSLLASGRGLAVWVGVSKHKGDDEVCKQLGS